MLFVEWKNYTLRKITITLITLILTLGFFVINNTKVKAEENVDACTSKTKNTTCTISTFSELSAWASNENAGVIGQLTKNITLTSQLTVSTAKTLDLNGYTITASSSYEGTMFLVKTNTLTVQDSSGNNSGKINGGYSSSTKHNNNIRGFKITSGTLNFISGTIQNMHVETNSSNNDAYGAAIRNSGGTLNLKGGIIQNCYAQWGGGAICIHAGCAFTMSGGTIKNSSAGERGGAICSYNNFTISGGSITGCKSPTGAVTVSGDCVLTLSGNAVFNNKNDYGNKDDIYLRNANKSTILIKDGFTQSSGNKIAIWTAIPLDKESFVAVKKDSSYTGTIGDLSSIFISAHGQEYIVKNGTTSLKTKGVTIIQQPVFSNVFEVKTNVADSTNPIQVSYQWYKSIIDAETKVNKTGSYVLGSGKSFETSFKIIGKTSDSTCKGAYDKDTTSWSIDTEEDKSRLFKISGLKAGQVISFLFEISNSIYTDIFLADAQENYFGEYISNESSGKYTVIIPEELGNKDFYICIRAKDSNDYTKATVKNILVKQRQDPVAMEGSTHPYIENAAPGADNYCEITCKNTDDGPTNIIKSADVEFGLVTKGNDQKIDVGSKDNVVIFLDKSEDKKYLAVKDMSVYLDGLKEANKVDSKNYKLEETVTPPNDINADEATVTLTLFGSYLTTLSPGEHTLFVKMSEKEGYECTPLNLKVNPIYWGIDANNVLHLSSEALSYSNKGATDGRFATASDQPWNSYATTIETVVIDKEIKPATTARWFEGLSNVTYMDISKLNTVINTDTTSMFKNCSKVETIKASSKFVTDGITTSTDMFTGCTALIGGNATPYDSTIIDKTYARFDNNAQVEGTTPGYFTQYNKLKLKANNTKVSIPYSCRDLDKNKEYGSLPSLMTTGYEFQWNSKDDGTGDVATTTTKMGDSERTIYGYNVPNTYKVKYNKTTGTGTDMKDSTFTYDSEKDKLSKNTYTKYGYKFIGWTKTSGSQVIDYTDEQTNTKFNLTSTKGDTVTLYAVWVENDFNVTLNPMGGTGGTASVVATYGSSMPVAIMPQKTNYIFNGYWDDPTDETSSKKYYNADGTSACTWDKNEDTTLYAHWRGGPYTVVFDANGGKGHMDNQVLIYNDATQRLNLNKFVNKGYSFLGWSKNKDAKTPTYSDGQRKPNITDIPNDTVTLYAIWGTKPDPDPKDESCEKVLGPTWHWNEELGVCEEVSVVKTRTK